MSTLRALEPLWRILALFGSALLAISLLVSNDVTFAIIPSPETEAESLVRALKARRFAAVKNELTESLRGSVDDAALKALLEQLRSSHRGILEAHGESSRQHGPHEAAATVAVRLEDKTQETIELPLKKEHGLWRVASIEPLGRLTR